MRDKKRYSKSSLDVPRLLASEDITRSPSPSHFNSHAFVPEAILTLLFNFSWFWCLCQEQHVSHGFVVSDTRKWSIYIPCSAHCGTTGLGVEIACWGAFWNLITVWERWNLMSICIEKTNWILQGSSVHLHFLFLDKAASSDPICSMARDVPFWSWETMKSFDKHVCRQCISDLITSSWSLVWWCFVYILATWTANTS